MASVYPGYSHSQCHYQVYTPPATPPSECRYLSSNPFRTPRENTKMSFFGSIKGKFSKKTSNNPFFNDSKDAPSDPPPAYTQDAPPASEASSALDIPRAPSAASSRASRISRDMVTNDDDPYAFLTTFDTIFLIDDSYSMTGSRWEQVRQVLKTIVPICTKRDKDGIDLYFINHMSKNRGDAGEGKADGGYYNITNPDAVTKIFNGTRPAGCTPTGQRLRSILKPYLAQLDAAGDPEAVKPINIIVITDGVPTDDPESVIVQAARKLDDLDAPLYQAGIQFFQVGSEPSASKSLRELDDDLVKQGVRDMVDTCSWNPNGGKGAARGELTASQILKAVLGAVVRKIDRASTP
ncbi:unnamed protein product [Clonostachys solani]|uniref:VWFA domain-containing protein n=1 Tax=Clonostachys solani TaxID=160281 RepID=A0A9N9YRI8_9HYPO|nr:unnamed protein product [Clonostachys solani]